jgi:hypothetical protein
LIAYKDKQIFSLNRVANIGWPEQTKFGQDKKTILIRWNNMWLLRYSSKMSGQRKRDDGIMVLGKNLAEEFMQALWNWVVGKGDNFGLNQYRKHYKAFRFKQY